MEISESNQSTANDLPVVDVLSPNEAVDYGERSLKPSTVGRVRRKRRPFSPEPNRSPHKISMRVKVKKKQSVQYDKNHCTEKSPENSFACDKCGSTSVVDPSRCRLPIDQNKKTQSARKKVDPSTNRILSLCNACGLAFSRPPKENKASISIEDRAMFLREAEAFAKSIAEKVGKPAAERLFCPAYKTKPCGCIQTYLSSTGEDESSLESRVEYLLQFFNTACDLNRRKNLFPEYDSEQRSKEDTSINPTERKHRQKEYEHFILDTRQALRENLRLCERACQRILLYSNNFLHKRLKSTPNQCSRVSRQLGRNCLGLLKPINELGSIMCCSDKCSRIALTHSALLEEWRKQATLGQRQARRVLAEMLTPSGGTKANCYKFISMVTGCGPTTISSVSHQMRITKGIREPPEHGLKKWHRENPRKPTKSFTEEVEQSQTDLIACFGQTQTSEQMQEDDPKQQLEQQRQELEEAKRQLYLKQQELDHCRQIIDQHFHQSNNASSNNLSKADAIKNALGDIDSDSQFLNLPMEATVTMMSDLSHEQSVQIIDLVPGTYITVPSSFDTSSILTVAPESKGVEIESTENIENHQPVYSENDLQLLSDSCSAGSLLIHSENGVQTIFKISSGQEEVNPIVENNQSMPTVNQEVYVSMPSVCNNDDNLLNPPEKVSNVSVISTCGLQPLQSHSSLNSSSLSLVVPPEEAGDISPSQRTTVITLSNADSEKSVFGGKKPDAVLQEPIDMLKNVGSEHCVQDLDPTNSLPSVILLTSQCQSDGNTLDSLEGLLE
ncbi:uncharacterized protein LOC117653695 [Thrips palmi]|uniref:Uncharacterized protein LOC117653695 n=1 Tax=Thrips palmi TaxID=161013 RepID=A0A6P9ABA4_THRPL|nr:uncharacterized protein LOC117653695 [Thrips palmi]